MDADVQEDFQDGHSPSLAFCFNSQRFFLAITFALLPEPAFREPPLLAICRLMFLMFVLLIGLSRICFFLATPSLFRMACKRFLFARPMANIRFHCVLSGALAVPGIRAMSLMNDFS